MRSMMVDADIGYLVAVYYFDSDSSSPKRLWAADNLPIDLEDELEYYAEEIYRNGGPVDHTVFRTIVIKSGEEYVVLVYLNH